MKRGSFTKTPSERVIHKFDYRQQKKKSPEVRYENPQIRRRENDFRDGHLRISIFKQLWSPNSSTEFITVGKREGDAAAHRSMSLMLDDGSHCMTPPFRGTPILVGNDPQTPLRLNRLAKHSICSLFVSRGYSWDWNGQPIVKTMSKVPSLWSFPQTQGYDDYTLNLQKSQYEFAII